jgi:hypothetical protein
MSKQVYAKAVKRRGLYRVIEKGTNKLLRGCQGGACDGGGHKDHDKAVRQCGHINESAYRKADK